MMVRIFFIYLILGLQIFFGKSFWLKTQLFIYMLITLLWFYHHATDQLGLSW